MPAFSSAVVVDKKYLQFKCSIFSNFRAYSSLGLSLLLLDTHLPSHTGSSHPLAASTAVSIISGVVVNVYQLTLWKEKKEAYPWCWWTFSPAHSHYGQYPATNTVPWMRGQEESHRSTPLCNISTVAVNNIKSIANVAN